MKAVRRNLREAKHALAKIADEQVRILAVALAGEVGDDGLRARTRIFESRNGEGIPSVTQRE
jgi:hypothetical protein